MNFASNSVLGETPKFVDLGLLPAHTTDKLKSVIGPTNRAGGFTDHSDWLASSGSNDGLEFIRCVGGQQPQIHELWSFAKDRITREVHTFARIDVGDFSGDWLQTNYATEIGCRVAIYGRKSINGSIKWLCVLAPFSILGWLGLNISWFLVRVGDRDLTMQLGPWELNL